MTIVLPTDYHSREMPSADPTERGAEDYGRGAGEDDNPFDDDDAGRDGWSVGHQGVAQEVEGVEPSHELGGEG